MIEEAVEVGPVSDMFASQLKGRETLLEILLIFGGLDGRLLLEGSVATPNPRQTRLSRHVC